MHTGGLDIMYIESVCTVNATYKSGSSLISTLFCAGTNMSSNENLKGNILLGPVQAGVIYTCTVTAFNNYGSDRETAGNITSNIGQPKNELFCSL